MILLNYIILLLNFNNIWYVEITPTRNEMSYCKLTWEHFKNKKTTDNTAAETVSSITYCYDGDKNVYVSCIFNKEESYVTPVGKNRYILNHEQRHFDIAFIYTNKVIKKLKLQQQLTDEIVESIYNQAIAELVNMQSQYDNETNNSENQKQQEVWNSKVDRLLAESN